MKSQPKNYLVGWTTEKGEIHFGDEDYMTFSEAIEKAKEYLKDGDDEDEVWEVFEVKSVKKYKLVKDTKIVEVPVKNS